MPLPVTESQIWWWKKDRCGWDQSFIYNEWLVKYDPAPGITILWPKTCSETNCKKTKSTVQLSIPSSVITASAWCSQSIHFSCTVKCKDIYCTCVNIYIYVDIIDVMDCLGASNNIQSKRICFNKHVLWTASYASASPAISWPLSVHDSGCTRHPVSGDVLVDRWAMEYWNDPKTFKHIDWRWLRCIVYVLTWSWWSSDIWSVRYFFKHFETFQARLLLLELQEKQFSHYTYHLDTVSRIPIMGYDNIFQNRVVS